MTVTVPKYNDDTNTDVTQESIQVQPQILETYNQNTSKPAGFKRTPQQVN
ncbi:unnamed protein product [Meloidogyne enterolobii]|uniref:Uncharacterized protein n=1 Tax=Meloidogyne enterolobii TaxID=390850 RepID=A0ACB0YI35_MELEN